MKIGAGNKGFTLIEVMISLAIFAVFAAAFVVNQGYLITDSTVIREESFLKDLAENTINEVIENPPELRESLTVTPETKTFEKNEDYEYTITYKKMIIPDISKMRGNDENNEDSNADLEARLFTQVKENLEKILWQVEVRVKNKITNETFSLSTWLYNDMAQVKIEGL